MQRDTLTQEPYRSEVRPQQEEDTIDLLELCMGLLDHWKFIAAAAAAGAVLAALYTFLLVTPLYKATSTIYVVSRNDSVLNLSDIQIGSALNAAAFIRKKSVHTFSLLCRLTPSAWPPDRPTRPSPAGCRRCSPPPPARAARPPRAPG